MSSPTAQRGVGWAANCKFCTSCSASKARQSGIWQNVLANFSSLCRTVTNRGLGQNRLQVSCEKQIHVLLVDSLMV